MTMAQPIWNQSTKHYDHEQKTDPKDRIDVEVGDSKDSEFHPQFKLMRWDNEANVSFRLIHDHIPGNITNDEDSGVITWTKGQWEARFYEDWGTPEGAYKFVELIMPTKPPTNETSFTVQSKDVDFFYQPPLTQQEIDDGAERPDEIVGSYAIYSKSSGRMNEVSGKEYKVGKVGHLKRAKLIDDNGDEIWADYNSDLNDTGVLTITVDQTWLDNAVYPVIVDPTFGYTSVGGSSHGISTANVQRYTDGTSAEDGNLDSISHYSRSESSSNNFIGGVYDSSRNLLASSSAASFNNTENWYSANFASESLSAQTCLVSIRAADGNTTGNSRYYYDTIATGNNYYYTSTSYSSSMPDPGPAPTGGNNREYSIYATYTASGGTLTTNVNDSVTITESVSLKINELVPTAYDDITITEVPTLDLDVITPQINEEDTITLSEDVTVETSVTTIDFKINIAGYTGVRVM